MPIRFFSSLSEDRRDALLLGLILLFLLALLVRDIDRPLLDRHAWRQTDTASFARGLARGEFDVLHPRFVAYYPDAYGIDGATETEFNLYPLIVAGLYRLFGVREALARLVSIQHRTSRRRPSSWTSFAPACRHPTARSWATWRPGTPTASRSAASMLRTTARVASGRKAGRARTPWGVGRWVMGGGSGGTGCKLLPHRDLAAIR